MVLVRSLIVAALLFAGCDMSTRRYEAPLDAKPDALADAAIDATLIDGGDGCDRDDFDGTTLDSAWSVLAGGSPVYTMTGSALAITDSPFANTPSNPSESWINDLDTDKGNQIARARAVGGGDFTVTGTVEWSSNNAQLVLGAIAVADAGATVTAMAGFIDSLTNGLGTPYARIRGTSGANDDQEHFGTQAGSGTAVVTIARVAGTLSIRIDGTEVLTATSAALISNLSILYVRYRLDTTEPEFGTFGVAHVEICTP
jgi:hypothetical protein